MHHNICSHCHDRDIRKSFLGRKRRLIKDHLKHRLMHGLELDVCWYTQWCPTNNTTLTSMTVSHSWQPLERVWYHKHSICSQSSQYTWRYLLHMFWRKIYPLFRYYTMEDESIDSSSIVKYRDSSSIVIDSFSNWRVF